jgi:hypothetical protein
MASSRGNRTPPPATPQPTRPGRTSLPSAVPRRAESQPQGPRRLSCLHHDPARFSTSPPDKSSDVARQTRRTPPHPPATRTRSRAAAGCWTRPRPGERKPRGMFRGNATTASVAARRARDLMRCICDPGGQKSVIHTTPYRPACARQTVTGVGAGNRQVGPCLPPDVHKPASVHAERRGTRGRPAAVTWWRQATRQGESDAHPATDARGGRRSGCSFPGRQTSL